MGEEFLFGVNRYMYRRSNMSARVLLNLLSELR